jgi:YD repeat-containing protein
MKSTKRLFSISILSMLLGLIGSHVFAQTANDYLLMQSLEKPLDGTMLQMQVGTNALWREKGVLKVRKQQEGDLPGTYRTLAEFDAKGNLTHKEEEGAKAMTVSYDAGGNVRKVSSFELNKLVSEQYFYYDRKGVLKKSILKFTADNSEIEGTYDPQYRLTRVRNFSKGIATKTVNIQYTYNEAGDLVAMSAPGLNATYLYSGGKLTQVKEEKVGQTTQTNIVWDGNNVQEFKKYEEKDGDLILAETRGVEYNAAGLPARKVVKGRGPNAKAVVTNMYYDQFEPNAVATRGDDWDGGGYGYGTPVVITWANPEADGRVTDSIYSLRLNLKPGVGQEMPEIKKMTLRLNHQLTNREIGNVVLRKKGVANDYYIEETLPLMEGGNTIYLEVETQLGKFNSGERFITYKNPDREIKVNNLHVLAIGVNDYMDDNLDLLNTSADVQKLVSSMEGQRGKMFKEVYTKSLLDKDATKANIEEAIRSIKGRAAKDDLVLIYFAGHGEETNGSFYLKPSDAKSGGEMEASAIDNRWILEEISRYNAPTLYFLDAGYASQSELGQATIGSANMDAVTNDFGNVIDNDDEIRIFVSSTSAKQKSNVKVDGESKSSVFTNAMMDGLNGKADKNANGLVTVEELGDYVSDAVLGATNWKQKPMIVKRGIGMVPLAKVGGK